MYAGTVTCAVRNMKAAVLTREVIDVFKVLSKVMVLYFRKLDYLTEM